MLLNSIMWIRGSPFVCTLIAMRALNEVWVGTFVSFGVDGQPGAQGHRFIGFKHFRECADLTDPSQLILEVSSWCLRGLVWVRVASFFAGRGQDGLQWATMSTRSGFQRLSRSVSSSYHLLYMSLAIGYCLLLRCLVGLGGPLDF